MNVRETVGRMAALAAVLLAALPLAAPRSATAAGPCAADVQRLCPGVQPGGGRIARCLHEHEKDVSDACKSHIGKMGRRAAGAWKVCEPDIAKLCPGVEVGGGRILACLKAHDTEVSAGCRDEMAKVREQK